MKKERKIVLSLIIAILFTGILFQTCLVFGIFGNLGLIYVPAYFNDNTEGGFINPDSVYSISIYGKKRFILSYNSLKYCKNLKSLDLDIFPDTKELKNVNFLRNLNKLESVSLQCNASDWSGLQECKNLTYVKIHDSNFANFDYLRNMDKINRLDIRTSSDLKCSDNVSFMSVDEIYIEAPAFDISGVKTAINTTFFAVKTKKIYNCDEIRNMNCLKHLRFIGTDIDIDNLKIISEIDSLEELDLTECVFSVGEEQLKNVLSGLYERKAEVKINDCEFR